MSSSSEHTFPTHEPPKRRLSWWRVFVAGILFTSILYLTVFGVHVWQEKRIIAAHDPWFAAYVDVTATPSYPFEQVGTPEAENVVLAFIVSSPSDPCTPSWGAAYTLDEARNTLDLDRRIARLRQQGGNIVVSFGGLLNDELAVKCQDQEALKKAYQLVIDRYEIDTIDLDLENAGLSDMEAAKRRASAIAALQSERRAQNKSLAVWLTIPVAPQGLTKAGTDAVAVMLSHNVDLAGINVMTMDYGQAKDEKDSMQKASEKALMEAHRQLGILYRQAGINLSSATLWTKIGATPMIGQNDIAGEIFTLDDAVGLNAFATSRGIGRMSMWSANRDIKCGDNYVDVTVVSDSCSGVDQEKFAFAMALGKGFDGDLAANAAIVTEEDPEVKTQAQDDPKTSPYRIWSETAAYLQGTKVVWHGNVYQAKWWTQGDMPDNPVLESWQTPWQLVGPVLPGEKPIPQPTLPPGTYPVWSGSEVYEAGQRVLVNGVPYQAKWWTQGNSPLASSSNPDGSPWAPLTQKQINEIVEQRVNISSSSAQ